jgi:hypothetical protein
VTGGNFSLAPPLHWSMYGDPFSIDSDPTPDPALSQDW